MKSKIGYIIALTNIYTLSYCIHKNLNYSNKKYVNTK